MCQIVLGPQFQNFLLKCCFLTWRKASESLNVSFWRLFVKGRYLHIFDMFKKDHDRQQCDQFWKSHQSGKSLHPTVLCLPDGGRGTGSGRISPACTWDPAGHCTQCIRGSKFELYKKLFWESKVYINYLLYCKIFKFYFAYQEFFSLS